MTTDAGATGPEPQGVLAELTVPFGSVGDGRYGTYFIGYARSPVTIEQMLVNMFVGSPEGNYDRLLDVSEAVTGTCSSCRRSRYWRAWATRRPHRAHPLRRPGQGRLDRSTSAA